MSFLIVTLTLLLAASDESEAVAMVLSVHGDVKLRPMDLLRSGDEVQVPASGSVRVVFLGDGHRETLNAGAKVKITESGGTPAEAVMREKTKLPTSQVDGLRTLAESARAGVSRVRDVDAPPPPVSPIAESIILSDRPDFAWTTVRGVEQYEIQLYRGEADRKDKAFWSARAAMEQCEYPKDRPALGRGEIYTWKVVVHGKGIVAKSKFTVATEEEIHDLDAVKKLSQSPDVADRLLAAMLFEANLVYDESNRLFESLVKELPKEPWVLLASARHLARLGRSEEAKKRETEALMLVGKSQTTP
jgi:hypothetical protein